jgi:hypothetical protein
MEVPLMYEKFGCHKVAGSTAVEFSLFIPDRSLAPSQYVSGGSPEIDHINVVGSFQAAAGDALWTALPSNLMTQAKFTDPADGITKGWKYSVQTGPLPDGFYEYKFLVVFNSGETRYVGDPCTRYGGTVNDNAAFVVGGRSLGTVTPLAVRPPLQDLVIYELMLDDFTANYRGARAPLDAVTDKLQYLKDLGINAIEFMPWTACPGYGFDWGYNPYAYFSVANQYTLDPANPLDKLVYLQDLISACHNMNLAVIMDGVFAHVDPGTPTVGFSYFWLYQEPADCPYTGNFADNTYFQGLEYGNLCTQEFIRDVCLYWIDRFKIDGIRFDETVGFYRAGDTTQGLPQLLSDLRAAPSEPVSGNFSLTLENSWDYDAINVTNIVAATSCWLDPYRSGAMEQLGSRQINPAIMRMLNSAESYEPGRWPTIYIENHDHESFIIKAGSRNLWWMMQPYMIALMTCAGAVLLHNGQEFGQLYWMPEPGAETPSAQRVVPRPLDWTLVSDGVGTAVSGLFNQLIGIRTAHAGLRSPNFYPPNWDQNATMLDANGFGIDTGRQIVVYHRWGQSSDGRLEKFYIVLNFSQTDQTTTVQFSDNGVWTDLISDWAPVVADNQLTVTVGSNWGHIFYRKY